MDSNPGPVVESVAHVSNHSEVHQFDWAEPLDSINTARAHTSEVAFGAISEFDCERYQQSPLPQPAFFELHNDEFTTNTEQKRERDVQDICQGASLRRKKKPKSLPKRPLSAYNLYFQRVRADLNSDGASRIGFHELGKIVGKKWKSLSEEEHKVFRELAIHDSERYRRDMEQHKKMESLKKEEEQNAEHSLRQEKSIDPARSDAVVPSCGDIPAPLNYGRAMSPSYGNSSQFSPSDYPLYHPPLQPPGQYPQAWGNDGSTPNNIRRLVYPKNDAVAPPVLKEGIPTNGKPLPPGSEVHIRDESGELRTYTVQYAMVTMPRDKAQDYINRLKCNPK